MSGNRLKTLVVAGCLAVGCGGCRSCLLESKGLHIRRPWARPQAVAPVEDPAVSSDQDRPVAPPTSASPAPPVSPDDLSQNAPPAEPVPEEQPEDLAQAAQMQASARLEKLGAQISTDEHGAVTSVDFAETPVTDADLKLLADCPELRELNLRGTLVGDDGLEAIAAATEIEFLGLTGTMVTDEGLAHLQTLHKLRFLTLGHTAVTDAGLAMLSACTQLEGLNLKATSVTAAGLVALQTQLPNCRIVSDVTTTTVIDSSDLPEPAVEDSGSSTDAADLPLPPRNDVGRPSETSIDALLPNENDGENPFADPAVELDVPAAGSRTPVDTRRPVAAGGPGRRLEQVLADSLDDPSVLRAIAQSYAAREEWEAAAAVLRVAVRQAPDDQDLHFDLGVAEARNGDFVSALMHLEQCGDLAVAHYNLGILMHEAGLDNASILAFRSALHYDPQLHSARVWLTQISPRQAQAAAGAIGQRPAMIGGPVITPSETHTPLPQNQATVDKTDAIHARATSFRSAMRERLSRLRSSDDSADE